MNLSLSCLVTFNQKKKILFKDNQTWNINVCGRQPQNSRKWQKIAPPALQSHTVIAQNVSGTQDNLKSLGLDGCRVHVEDSIIDTKFKQIPSHPVCVSDSKPQANTEERKMKKVKR